MTISTLKALGRKVWQAANGEHVRVYVDHDTAIRLWREQTDQKVVQGKVLAALSKIYYDVVAGSMACQYPDESYRRRVLESLTVAVAVMDQGPDLDSMTTAQRLATVLAAFPVPTVPTTQRKYDHEADGCLAPWKE